MLVLVWVAVAMLLLVLLVLLVSMPVLRQQRMVSIPHVHVVTWNTLHPRKQGIDSVGSVQMI
jgi:hypothetical protein